MNFSISQLLFVGLAYMLFLFATAYITDRGWLPKKIVRHPVTYILSLGVYASVWTFYGSLGIAHDYGYSFLAAYFGASAAFILAPIVLIPLLRITRTYQLSSIADLFAFRFRSQQAGTFVTLLMVIAALPLLSIQIQAITDSVYILNDEVEENSIAFGFCALTAIFAILFGARHASTRKKNEGLVVAMAVESIVKLVAITALGVYCLYGIFGGNAELENWLNNNSLALSFRYSPVEDEAWKTLLLAFFTSAIVMPQMFHMLFTENLNPKAIFKASWGFPLFLFIMALAIPPILWAGIKLGLASSPEYYGLYLGLYSNSGLLTTVAFIGGLSAASGMIIITMIALSGMVINHLVLPFYEHQGSDKLYQRILWARRGAILLISLLGFVFYLMIGPGNNRSHLGLMAFVAFMQFLPGLLSTLFWPGGSRIGFMAGLATGIGTWLFTMLLPMISGSSFPLDYVLSETSWHQSAIYALAANIGVFILVSIVFPPSREELHAANSCALNAVHRPQATRLRLSSVEHLVEILTPRLGQQTAWRETREALKELALNEDEQRPQALTKLRDQMEINLSGLLGPVEAVTILTPNNEDIESDSYGNSNIHLMENHLESYQDQLTGLAAELDELRRFHRETLQRLPVGVCSVSSNRTILLWNTEMENYTSITKEEAADGDLSNISEPWGSLLMDFASQDQSHLHNQKIIIKGSPRWFTFHKTAIEESSSGFSSQVILIEDETETQLLSEELIHSERLASIGRLAAGVAHEIGNPITGIACLAQNLRYETQNEEVLYSGKQILEQTDRVDRIVKSLMNFAHSGTIGKVEEPQPFNLLSCVHEAINFVSFDERSKHIRYINRCPDYFYVLGDAQRFLQVLVNLLNNAADASEPGQEVVVDATIRNEQIVVSVEDQGSGIPPDIQDQLFEPFFTTKDPGKGTGLGLSLVYSIIEEHHGSVQIESPVDKAQNRGTKVVISLPFKPDLHNLEVLQGTGQ